MSLTDLDVFLRELARRSGEVILPFFRTQMTVIDKDRGHSFDPVTEADRAAESVIRTMIGERFPEHGIIGEELGDERIDAEYVWVIDPIDGTRSFVCGIPLWGTLIGLTRQRIPVQGLLHQPYTGELFTGDSRGSFLEHASGERRRLFTRPCERLEDAYLMTTSPGLFSGAAAKAYAALEARTKLVRYGADCYAYAMLASGQIDLVVETGLKPYDIVPLVPIIEGAGGIVTNWDGHPVTGGGSVVAAGDARLHAEALTLLRSGGWLQADGLDAGPGLK